MFEIEKAGAEDASTLQDLWVRTFRQAYANLHSEENIRLYCADNYSIGQTRAALADPATDCVIARQGGAPAGLYVVKHHDCPARKLDGGASELKQIYVLAEYYGAGLGKALFESALDAIRAKGRQWVWLVVSDKNTRAQRFYEKQSFTRVGAGPVLEVGTDRLPSTILAAPVQSAG